MKVGDRVLVPTAMKKAMELDSHEVVIVDMNEGRPYVIVRGKPRPGAKFWQEGDRRHCPGLFMIAKRTLRQTAN